MPGTAKKTLKHGPIFWIVAAVGVLAMVLALCFVDLKSLHEKVEGLNGALVILLMIILPLLGFPASVLYVVAGAKFGRAWGLALAMIAIATHLMASWWIAHSWLKKPLDALFRRTRYHKPQIPEGEYLPVCLLIALMPGVPYTIKNYLLALSGAPFRYFFWCVLPAHFFSASLGILFGDFTGSMTRPKIIFLICYGIVVSGLSFYVVRRLRSRKGLDRSVVFGE
jgi:uncharacterized membrane protein YdjX (TVP38/TMEM64 family)